MAAGGAVIGALRVVLGADSADLEKGLKTASSRLQSFGASIAGIGAAAGAAFGGIAVALGVAVRNTLTEADKLGKMAQSVGVPVEELSRLKHAADLSDVSLEALGKSMGKLSRNMVEVAGGAKNDVTQAFAALGISVRNTDGTLKSSSQVLTEIAGKFEGYKDGAAKTALAITLLGRAGADLIPMLNAGADGMREAMAEADQLGITLSSNTSLAAESFNDNLTRLGKVKDGIVLKITAELAPALAVLSERFISAAKDGGIVELASKGIINVMNLLAAEIAEVSIRLKSLGEYWNAVKTLFTTKDLGEFKNAWSDIWSGIDERTSAAVTSMRASVGTFWEDVTLRGEGAVYSLGGHVEKSAALLKKLNDSFGKMDAPVPVAASELAKGIAAAEREMQKLYAAAKRTFESTRTPAEEFALRIAEINRQFAVGGFSAETYARAVAQAQDRMVQANPIAQALGSSLTSAFDRAIQGGMKLSDVLKGLLQDLSRALANQAFKSLLFGNSGTGGTFGGLLGSLFGGAGSPMNILPGFAAGGSFTVGGAGGIDSQIAAMRVTPGERVTVSKKGEGAGGSPINIVNNNDFRGADPGSEARIKAYVDASSQRAVSQAVGMVGKTRSESPGYLRPR